jgi:hypothetical protein
MTTAREWRERKIRAAHKQETGQHYLSRMIPLSSDQLRDRDALMRSALSKLDAGDYPGFWHGMSLVRAWTMTKSPNADLLFPQENVNA